MFVRKCLHLQSGRHFFALGLRLRFRNHVLQRTPLLLRLKVRYPVRRIVRNQLLYHPPVAFPGHVTRR